MTSRPPLQSDSPTANQTVVDSEAAIQTVLEVLADAESRNILEVTAKHSLTASQISERCELALSTTYRKLDELTDTGLLAKRTRFPISGEHTNEYTRLVDDIVIQPADDWGIKVQIFHRDGPGSTVVGAKWGETDD